MPNKSHAPSEDVVLCAVALGHAIRADGNIEVGEPLMVEVLLRDSDGNALDEYRLMVVRQHPPQEEVPA